MGPVTQRDIAVRHPGEKCMGRPERPLDASNGPIAAFAHDLRSLRSRAGNPSYRELARKALFAPSVLSSAASGRRLPTLAVTLAFVSACGGDRTAWERRWREVAGQVGVAPAEPRDERVTSLPPNNVPFGPPGAATHSMIHLTRPAQLPMGSSTFVGRESVLAQAKALIEAGQQVKMPLLVSGPIGVGKTAFALRLAADLASRFPHGQLYADLGELGKESQSANSIVRGFLRALGVPTHLVPDDPMQRIGLYRSLLAQRKLFVLLANVRDESQVRPLLAHTSHSQVVITSRARLLGLDDTHRIDLDVFTRAESVELICWLAGEPRVRSEPEAAEAIAEICGDLPLAVNIAGRKIAARAEWSIAYLAEQLADREHLMDALSVGDVNVRDRFAAAYRQLPSLGRQVVEQLGLGATGWTSAAAVASGLGMPLEQADELLESLVDAGILRRAGVAGRYSAAALVSAFVVDAHRDADPVPVTLVDRRARRTLIGSIRRLPSTTSDIH
jgi:DNA polymerase III delta prime subunit